MTRPLPTDPHPDRDPTDDCPPPGSDGWVPGCTYCDRCREKARRWMQEHEPEGDDR